MLTQSQIASDSVIKQNEVPKANDYGDTLSSLVDMVMMIMKTYGGGTWRTYCQPLKNPTKCS
ncbi:MAG: hypothetical protein AB8V47_06745, partial [Francisella endosymbiont of Hyalomma asiaticum]